MSKLVLTTTDRRPLGPVYPLGFSIVDGALVGPGGDPCPLPDARAGARLVKVSPRTAAAVMAAAAADELDGLVIDDDHQLAKARVRKVAAKKGGKAKRR